MDTADRKVAEIMTDLVVTMGVDRTWEDAARRMSARNIHHLILLDAKGEPLGVLSSFDFLACALDPEAELTKKLLADTRPKRPLITLRPEDTLGHAANLMNNHQVECLPVLNQDRRVLGIITPRDLMMAMFPA